MKFIIKTTDLTTGEVRHYSNLKYAALDVDSPCDVTYRAVQKAKKASQTKQGQQYAGLESEGHKWGYPFTAGFCKFDAVPVYYRENITLRGKDYEDD